MDNINFFNEGFTSISDNTFKDFQHAKNLNLNSNNLKNIEPRGFNGLNKLECLNLSHNNPMLFSTMESETFYGLDSLVGLNISHNNNLWVICSSFLTILYFIKVLFLFLRMMMIQIMQSYLKIKQYSLH